MKNLIDLAKDRSAVGRQSLAHAVGELHQRHETSLTEQERTMLNDICHVLAEDAEARVRIALAEKLAKAKNVPRDLIVKLANDNINIAQDVILYNVQLKDPDLILLVRQKSLAHRLAIARRFGIDGDVSQALVDTNDVNVIRILLENLSASLNYPTIETLVTKSRDIESWHALLLYRPEITPKLAQKMYGWVSSTLRDYILDNFEIDPNQLDNALQETVAELISADNWFEDHDPAITHLIGLIERSQHNLGEVLCEMLRMGNVSSFERLFSKLLHLPRDTTQQILFGNATEGFGIACQALAIAERDFIVMNHLLNSDNNDKRKSAVLNKVVQFYNEIDRNYARQMVVQWGEDPMYIKHAISNINRNIARNDQKSISNARSALH
jgi:uncharacterized protein (DUF2336 family)